MTQHKMPLSRAIICILLSVLFVSGSALMGWLYFIHQRDLRYNGDRYNIVAIVQNSEQAESLNTAYLAEILGLSIDRPSNLYRFDPNDAERKLESCPLLKRASVKKIPPGTLYISYSMRTPFAIPGDCPNMAVDKTGHLFPYSPFFTPKHLPVFYLGVDPEEVKAGQRLQNIELFTLAVEIASLFEKPAFDRFFLKQIDLSYYDSENYGRKQIVVILEELIYDLFSGKKERTFYLRLGCDHYRQDIVNFYYLHRRISGDPTQNGSDPIVIDFRIPHLAFIKYLPQKKSI